MADIIKFRSKTPRRKSRAEVSLGIEKDICNARDLRNLIDGWIVPKMVDDWIEQAKLDAKPQATEDN